jgi:hypothetical protein
MAWVDTTTKRRSLYNFFPKKTAEDGQGPAWLVRVDGHANAGTFSAGGQFGSPDATTEVLASLAWGNYHAAIRVRRTFLDEYRQSPQRIERYVNEQLDAAFADMLDTIDADLMTGTGTSGAGDPNIVGLQAMIDDGVSTATYANVSRSTYSSWACQQNDNGGGGDRSLTEAILLAGSNALRITNEGDWTVGIFEKATLDTYAADSALPAIQGNISGTMGERIVASGGYTGYYFEGKPLLAIPNLTTSRGYMLDMSMESNFCIEEVRGVQIDPPQLVNDDLIYNITYRCQLVGKNPPKTAVKFEEIT